MEIFVFTIMIVGIFAIIIAATFLRAYVFTILWGWFVVPIFNLPALNIVSSMGLMIILGMLTSKFNDFNKPDKKDMWKPYFIIFVYPLLSLFIGYIVKGYM